MRPLGSFLILILMLSTVSLAAEPVEVRSGEHADFSRLVLQFDQPTEWAIGRSGRGYQVRFDRPDISLDFSRTFDLIPKTRIARLIPSNVPAGFLIELNCDCFADAFELRERRLVIDIKSGPIPQDARFEAPLTTGRTWPDSATAQTSWRKPLTPAGSNLLDANVAAVPPEAIKFPIAKRTGQNPLPYDFSMAPRAGQTGGNILQTTVPAPSPVEAMERKIAEGLGRALAQGVLAAKGGRLGLAPVKTSAEESKPMISVSAAGLGDHMIVGSDLDVSNPAISPASNNQNSRPCLPPEWFDIGSWGKQGQPISAISDARAALFREFDETSPKAVETLAKAYLFAGFGAEAANVISEFDFTGSSRSTLLALAALVDGRTPENAIPVSQIYCAAGGAIWAILGAKNLPPGWASRTQDIQAEFAGLPRHIRQNIGPDLSRKFNEVGQKEAALMIRNSVSREANSLIPEITLIKAEQSREEGRVENAKELFEQLVGTGNDVSANALISLMELKITQDETVETNLIELAGSLAFEIYGTEVGQKLVEVQARSFAANGDFDSAIAVLRQAEERSILPKLGLTRNWEFLLNQLVASAPDGVFLRQVFENSGLFESSTFSRRLIRDISSRMISLGVPGRAIEILNAPDTPDLDDRLILADALLEMGSPKAAIDILQPVSDRRARGRRERAFADLNEFGKIDTQSGWLDSKELQVRTAFALEDWQTAMTAGRGREAKAAEILLALEGSSEKGDLASTALNRAFADESMDTLIAKNTKAISASSETRSAIESLLSVMRQD